MATGVEHDSSSEAFWTLTDEQIDVLRSHGEVQQTQDGEVLFQQGELTCDFYVVLEGEVELIEPTLVTRVASWRDRASAGRARPRPAGRCRHPSSPARRTRSCGALTCAFGEPACQLARRSSCSRVSTTLPTF